jgi:cellulose synthase (UDP-forming)
VRLNIFFSEFPWIVVLATTFFCFLMAAVLRAMLRRRARARLQGTE